MPYIKNFDKIEDLI